MTNQPLPFSQDGGRVLIFVPLHHLIKHWVAVLRNEETPTPLFRNAMAELGRLLIYEALRDCLPTISLEIQSPTGIASVEFVDPQEPVAIIPILRACLALAEYASSILPPTRTYHLGATMVAALSLIKEHGVDAKQMKVVSAVASPSALKLQGDQFPGLHVYAGTIDATVDDKGYIIPGFGDAGDRSFGTC